MDLGLILVTDAVMCGLVGRVFLRLVLTLNVDLLIGIRKERRNERFVFYRV